MQIDGRRATLGTLAVVIAASLFGILGPVSRLAGDRAGIETLAFVTWRSLLGAVVVGCLLAFRMSRGQPIVGVRAMSVRARSSLLVAAVSGVILNLAIFIAFARVTVALALLGFYTYPALVTLAVILIERRRPDRIQLAALAMATAGMAIVLLGGVDPASGLSFDVLGLVLALVAAVAQTVFVLVSRHGYAAVPIDQASFVVLAGGALGFLAIALLTGTGPAIVSPVSNPIAWSYLVAGGVLGAGIPTTLFLLGIRWIGGVRSGILALLEPVVGVLLAAILLNELLRPIQLLGGALVLSAAFLLQRTPSQPGPQAGPGSDARQGPAGQSGEASAEAAGAQPPPLV
ncbi:MAG: DMT family transporter [Chloroflexota bacterium]